MAIDSDTPEKVKKRPTIASVLVPVSIVLAGTLFLVTFLRERPVQSLVEPRATVSPNGGSDLGPIQLKVGEVIPDLTFTDLDGSKTKLSDLHAKVVVINFWATWCGPCVKEMPALQSLSDEYGNKGLTVVGVNVDEDPETVLAPFLSKHEIKFKSYVDPHGNLADRFSVSGLPLTLIVDEKRKLLLHHLGDEEWFDTNYRKQFELWLAGTPSG